MRQLGADLATVLRAGDLVVLDGPLGAGKTTMTQGIGAALQVRGPVTSPTFVIARSHRGPRAGLLHMDAYRLSGAGEVDDLDLDDELSRSVTVVEWGAGKVEELAPSHLLVRISREAQASGAGADAADPAAGRRQVRVSPFGPRWADLQVPAGTASAEGHGTADSVPEGR